MNNRPRDRSPEAALRHAALAARRLAFTGVLVLALFTVLTGTLAWRLRDSQLAGLVSRDAEILASVVQLRLAPIEDELLLDADLPREDLLLEQLLDVASLRGVLGLRLYDETGALARAVPETFLGLPCPAAELHRPPADRAEPPPTAVFLPKAAPAAWLAPGRPSEGLSVPLLLVRLPLRLPVTGESLGHAEFLIDGASLATRRHALDRELLFQSGWLLGAALLVGVALHHRAWRGLRRHAHELAAEQRRLIRANADLALAVKTSAIGGVTAHLMHDLKGSLAGLEAFIRAGRADPSALAPADWDAAAGSAHDLRHLSAEIADILRSLETGEGVDLDAAELVSVLQTQHEPAARARRVSLRCELGAAAVVDGRQSQLVLLILGNLLRNAIEASPPEGRVTLAAEAATEGTRWLVTDQGPGVPEHLRNTLFRPVRSTKPDGGGIGLAISAQIAAHLRARLEVVSTGPSGSVFQLFVPPPPIVSDSAP